MNDFKPLKNADFTIIFCFALLIIFGLVILASASANLGQSRFDDNYFFLKHQLLRGLIPGLIGFFIALKLYYGFYEKISGAMLLFAIFLLALLFTPLGLKAGGAERWLALGSFSFQPSEFLKPAFILYLAAWLAGRKDRRDHVWRGFLPFFVILSLLGGILLGQSSTSTFALLLVTACLMYFVGGAKNSFLISLFVAGGLILLTVSYFSPYRWQRIVTFFKPSENIETSGYHINQALTAIGSGGLYGVGFGQSTTKIKYLPEPIGDSIFAVAAEELGFIGVIAIIAVIMILSFRIILLSRQIPHKFGQLALIGFGSILAVQSFMNIAAISGLIPLTGVPLPLMSYGGTGLVSYMTMAGIIGNISKYARK